MSNISTLHINHNLYWDPAAVTFEWNGRGLYGLGLAQWRQATGFDLSSLVANPHFSSTATLALKANSPAIDAGTRLASVRHDFNGARRPRTGHYDIGAYQNRE